MPAPVLKGTPISLKSTGTSQFWLSATGVAVGDAVKVVRKTGANGYWSGTVDKIHPKGARAKVRYDSGPPPLTIRPKKGRSWGPGDVIEVTITVTNTAIPPQSGSSDAEVIIDAD